MIIIETCPKCGHDLHDEVICTYPPIPRKICYSCGWSWEGEPERIMRVPFGGNGLNDFNNNDDISLNNYLNCEPISIFNQSACINCSNNPKNGGNGICNCTLGQIHITC